MNERRVLIIIPCFNEEAAIVPLLQEIAACGAGYGVVVVDDGSSDATFARAARLAPTLRLLRNMGIGTAVQTGVKYARAHGYDFCVQVDGDGQHPPAEIVKLLRAYDEAPCAVIVGSRYLQNDAFRSTWARRFGNRAIAGALNPEIIASKVAIPLDLLSRFAKPVVLTLGVINRGVLRILGIRDDARNVITQEEIQLLVS